MHFPDGIHDTFESLNMRLRTETELAITWHDIGRGWLPSAPTVRLFSY